MNKKLLLVVDDDPKILDVITIYLEDEFEVITAKNGEEAIEKVQEQKPDAVVLDVMMPEMNGYDVAKWLKTKREYNPIPIVMLTALDKRGDQITGFRVGADKYITKPFSLEDLKSTVEDVIKKNGNKPGANQKYLSINFDMRSDLSYIQEINELIANLYENTDLSEDRIEDIRFILNEVISNAVEHGNKSDASKLVHIQATLYEDRLVFQIEDEGEGFDINNVPDPSKVIDKLIAGDTDVPEIENRERPGGWGIFMIKSMADQVEFNEKGNKITLTKFLENPLTV
jgi:DNA-binding response OmpR family regulator